MRRLAWSVLGAVVVTLTAPAAAAAHLRIGTVAVDFRVSLLAPRPAGERAFTVSVDQSDRALRLGVRRGNRVVVLGYLGEPFLRVDGAGVAINTTSPTAAEAGLVSEGKPSGWALDQARGPAVWRDPRVQRMRKGVQDAPWTIPILVNGRPDRISGELHRVAAPSLLIWFLVAGATAGVGVAAAFGRRPLRTVCVLLGGVATIAAIVTASAFAFEPHAVGGRVATVYELVFAAGGGAFAVWGPPELRAAAAAWLGLLALTVGLAFVQVFLHGAVLSVLPAALTRATDAVAIGSGAAGSVLGALCYTLAPAHSPAPTGG